MSYPLPSKFNLWAPCSYQGDSHFIQETQQVIDRFYEATNTTTIAELTKCLNVKR